MVGNACHIDQSASADRGFYQGATQRRDGSRACHEHLRRSRTGPAQQQQFFDVQSVFSKEPLLLSDEQRHKDAARRSVADRDLLFFRLRKCLALRWRRDKNKQQPKKNTAAQSKIKHNLPPPTAGA